MANYLEVIDLKEVKLPFLCFKWKNCFCYFNKMSYFKDYHTIDFNCNESRIFEAISPRQRTRPIYLSSGESWRIKSAKNPWRRINYGTCVRKRTAQTAGSHELSACRHGEVEMDPADPDDRLDAGRWLFDGATVQHARRHRRLRGRGAAAGRSSQVRGVQRAHRLVRSEAPQGPSTYRPRDPGEDTQLRWSPVSACFHLLRWLDELPSW